jgi:hypothetical protein
MATSNTINASAMLKENNTSSKNGGIGSTIIANAASTSIGVPMPLKELSFTCFT